MATETPVANIKWDEIGAHIFRPDVCSVSSTRDELSFLFGSYGTEAIGPDEIDVKLLKRIIVSPFVAKRLAELLRKILQDHESHYGPLGRESSASTGLSGRASLSIHLPSSLSAGTAEGQTLFQLINALGVVYVYERSFKMSHKRLLGNRFLFTLDNNSLKQLPPERITGLCERINMPQNLLADFIDNLPQAHYVHFGFEENESGSIYKAYAQFSQIPAPEAGTSGPAPLLLYLGFKWDTADNAKQAVSRYTYYPLITPEKIAERVSDIYGSARLPYEVVKNITDIASAIIDHTRISYLEVTEENSPRRSFDINVYDANLLISEQYPLLGRAAQYYGISFGDFHGLYDGIKDSILGHISGGIDREGKDFITIYHGGQAVRMQEAEPSFRAETGQRIATVRRKEPRFSGAESRDIKAFKLFDLVKGLKVPIDTEYSFKAVDKTLLPDRCLIGFPLQFLPQKPDESILNICRKLEMPQPFQETLRENVHNARVVLFGFERDQKNVFYKTYLEFGRVVNGVEKDLNDRASFMMHLAFKWNINDQSQRAVTKYHCFPNLSDNDILERVTSQNFFSDERKGYLGIVKAILDLTVTRIHPYDILYLEAEEEGNPRTSFNIKTFNANLRMKEVYPYLVDVSRYFSIPHEEYHKAYEPVKNLIFGNIQAGIDRRGREFFTIYYKERGNPKRQRKEKSLDG